MNDEPTDDAPARDELPRDEPTHGQLMKKLREVETISRANKSRLDEIAGAGKFGKWFLVFLVGLGGLVLALSQFLTGGK